MKKLAAIFVHGIGGNDENWASDKILALHAKVLGRLKSFLGEAAPAAASDVLAVKSVYWKTALEKPQSSLGRVLAKYFSVVLKLAPFPLRWLYEKIYEIQNRVITSFIGDVIGYLAREGTIGVHARLDAKLRELETEIGGAEIPLTFISHSLGTVISSNYVYDLTDAERKKNRNQMHPRFRLHNFFTVGSPIALFSMKFSGPDEFRFPIEMEDVNGRWVNILDKDDPISMPLRPLNEPYRRAVHADYLADAGWLWASAHTEYFSRTEALDLIAEKLAADWVHLNGGSAAGLYEKFDERLAKKSLP